MSILLGEIVRAQGLSLGGPYSKVLKSLISHRLPPRTASDLRGSCLAKILQASLFPIFAAFLISASSFFSSEVFH